MQNVTILILIIVAVVAMFIGGWVSFADVNQKATITIHKDEVKRDTESALQKGEALLKDATQEGRQLIDQTERSLDKSDPESVKSEQSDLKADS